MACGRIQCLAPATNPTSLVVADGSRFQNNQEQVEPLGTFSGILVAIQYWAAAVHCRRDCPGLVGGARFVPVAPKSGSRFQHSDRLWNRRGESFQDAGPCCDDLGGYSRRQSLTLVGSGPSCAKLRRPDP